MSQIVYGEYALTAELQAALERFVQTSACPKYLKDAWQAAQK